MSETDERADVLDPTALDAAFDAFLDDSVATAEDHRAARAGTLWALAAIPVAFAGIALLAAVAIPPLYFLVALAAASR